MGKSLAVFCIFTLPILYAGAEDCHYGDNPPIAIIGEKLTLSCTLKMCFTTEYNWFNITGNASLSEKSGTLVVSEIVQSVDEVGGHEYMCQCDSSTAVGCRLFKIGVKPKVQLYTSVLVARSGSSVNVTCKADSYPPANSEDNYHMKHPRDHDINVILLPERNGVVHIITNASKEIDSGEYECTVIVKLDEYSTPLQSDNALTNLTVYDSPVILRTENFTIFDVGQSAILECVVSGIDNKDMNVWVNWTTSKNESVNESHIMLRRGNSFYLAIFNATAGDYACQVFSTYFPDKPEDTKIASILKAELNKKTDDGNSTLVLASALLSVVALIAIATACALGVWVWRLRHRKNQHGKSENYGVFTNKEEDEKEKQSSPSESCPSGTLAEESVSSGSKQHNDQRPMINLASKSPIESTGSEVYADILMTGEQSLKGEVNQVPEQLIRSQEESVSDGSEAKQEQDFSEESCVDEEVEEHKETGSAAPSRTGSISCLLVTEEK